MILSILAVLLVPVLVVVADVAVLVVVSATKVDCDGRSDVVVILVFIISYYERTAVLKYELSFSQRKLSCLFSVVRGDDGVCFSKEVIPSQ